MLEFLSLPEIQGITIGFLTFVIIGTFHPIVIRQQAERVRKGWFPRNPKRKYDFDEDK